MITAQQIIFACLVIFILYWIISAGSVKPIQETKGWLSGNWYSILLVTGFLFIVNLRFMARIGIPVSSLAVILVAHSPIANVVSVVLAVAGLLVAIIARRTLAENWSGAVAIKEEHELITTGLYHYVRHPSYTGVVVMCFGSVLAFGTLGACIGFLIIILAVSFKLHDEEKLLTEHFDGAYVSYKKRTKTLIPFVW